MKLLVIGLDCAAPEILLEDERLSNFRRLMEGGCYGRLESVVPPITVPAWMCMSTSRDPGSLGVYGFRNRGDYSYDSLRIVNSRSIRGLAIWDQIAMEGGKSVVIGVPPSYPPRKVNGISVGCFLTPDTASDTYTHPPEIAEEIAGLVGEYPVDVKGFRTDDKDWLRDQIYEMSRAHFAVVKHYLRNTEWDYFQFVEIGLDRMHHGFWKYHDPAHRRHEPGNPYMDVVRDYYAYLDRELGEIFEELTEDTAILVLSDHGARALDGGFCVNEWLIEQGLLVLEHYPEDVRPFAELDVDWEKTRVWGEGGYYGRIFFNVKGREPAGVIEPAEYEAFRDDLKERLEATVDERGEALGTLVFKPEEAYREVRNIAPDLIVHFGGLAWRSIGGVGYGSVHVQENDTGPDDCNHAQFGAFILAASNSPVFGEIEGAHLLDMAPTLLELGGYDIPDSMQGTSLVRGVAASLERNEGLSPDREEIIRQRLSGLGYIS
ncbi:MAG: alkaline phosphatase family protein [Gemmatimonadota bacterium]